MGDRLLLDWRSAKKLQMVWHFEDHMGVELSKRYYLWSITLLGNQPGFKNIVALLNFSVGVNGNILKCGISWKRLLIEQSGWKLGTGGPGECIFHVWFFVFRLGSIGAFCKISNVKISKRYCSHIFHPISSNIYAKYSNQGKIQAVHFLANYQGLQVLWLFEVSLNTGHDYIRFEISKIEQNLQFS